MISINKKRRPAKTKPPLFLGEVEGSHSQNTFRRQYQTWMTEVVNHFSLTAEKRSEAENAISTWVKSHYYAALKKPGIPVSIGEAQNVYKGLQKLEMELKQVHRPDLRRLVLAAKKEAKERIARGKPFQFSSKNGLAVQTALTANIRDSLGFANFAVFATHAEGLMAIAHAAAKSTQN